MPIYIYLNDLRGVDKALKLTQVKDKKKNRNLKSEIYLLK